MKMCVSQITSTEAKGRKRQRGNEIKGKNTFEGGVAKYTG